MGTDHSEKSADSVTIFVTIEGETQTLTIEWPESSSVGELLAEIRRRHPEGDVAAVHVSLEDEDMPVNDSAQLRSVLVEPRHRRIHVHRCRRVKVTVEYNNETRAEDFPPASTVNRVFRWAVGPKGFDVAADSHDLVLQVAGTTTPLPPSTHIGTLLRDRNCKLALQLVPKDRPQGYAAR